MYEEDFVKDEIIEFEIDGRKFSYKPVDAGQENDWANEYIEVIEGKIKQDFAQLNRCKSRNLVSAPYEKYGKKWEELSLEDRWQILRKLKPGMFDKIFKKIKEIDEGDTQKKT